MYECYNRKSDEFREFGAKIIENGALDQKIWPLEAFRGKTDTLGSSGKFCNFLEWLDGFGAKDRVLAVFGKFLGIFVKFGMG
jgi:hypothetical protein